jgi:SAM-dependent methyltransferase
VSGIATVSPMRASPIEVQSDNWEEHWAQYSDTASTNPAQEYRRRLIIDALQKSAKTSPIVRLVDIGSGQGDMLRELQRAIPNIDRLLGLELSASGVAIAKSKVPDAVFVKTDLLLDTSGQEPYVHFASHAVCSEVLEHVDDPVLLLTHAAQYLQDGAQIVVTVPGGPRSAFDRHIGHRRHFSKRRIHAVLDEAGFHDISVRAAGFPVFNIYKLMVIIAGQRLITAAASPDSVNRFPAKVFAILFRLPMPRSLFGWQLIATAKVSRAT